MKMATLPSEGPERYSSTPTLILSSGSKLPRGPARLSSRALMASR